MSSYPYDLYSLEQLRALLDTNTPEGRKLINDILAIEWTKHQIDYLADTIAIEHYQAEKQHEAQERLMADYLHYAKAEKDRLETWREADARTYGTSESQQQYADYAISQVAVQAEWQALYQKEATATMDRLDMAIREGKLTLPAGVELTEAKRAQLERALLPPPVSHLMSVGKGHPITQALAHDPSDTGLLHVARNVVNLQRAIRGISFAGILGGIEDHRCSGPALLGVMKGLKKAGVVDQADPDHEAKVTCCANDLRCQRGKQRVRDDIEEEEEARRHARKKPKKV